jgi:hypothetical protein
MLFVIVGHVSMIELPCDSRVAVGHPSNNFSIPNLCATRLVKPMSRVVVVKMAIGHVVVRVVKFRAGIIW